MKSDSITRFLKSDLLDPSQKQKQEKLCPKLPHVTLQVTAVVELDNVIIVGLDWADPDDAWVGVDCGESELDGDECDDAEDTVAPHWGASFCR